MSPSQNYPYQDGDVVVLGPDIFASLDGSVLCWKGENYVRQNEPSLTSNINVTTVPSAHEIGHAVSRALRAIRRRGGDR